MRRIVILPSGMAGVRAASRLKRKDHSCEINVIVPSGAGEHKRAGPFTSYLADRVPGKMLEKLEHRQLGCVEVDELGLDVENSQVTAKSKRGELTVRFTELVLEFEALPRVPRNLRQTDNVLSWPGSLFYSDFAALDRALTTESETDAEPVVIIGGGLAALEAVGLALQGADPAYARPGRQVRPVCWVRTKNSGPEPYNPLEQDVWQYLLHQLKSFERLTVLDWSRVFPEKLEFHFTGNKLVKLGCPPPQSEKKPAEGNAPQKDEANPQHEISGAGFIWADSLMVQHPFAGQAGLEIEKNGLIKAGPHGETIQPHLYAMGSGVALRSMHLPRSSVLGGGKGLPCPPLVDDAGAEVQGRYLADRMTSSPDAPHLPCWQGLGSRSVAISEHLHVGRIGLGEAELKNADFEYEYSVALVPWAISGNSAIKPAVGSGGGEKTATGPQDAASPWNTPGLMLRMICSKGSGELLGAQFVSYNIGLEAEAVLATLIPMLRSGGEVRELARMEIPGRAGGALRSVAGMLANKLAGDFMSISPDELLASKEAGAEFFILDLRPPHLWHKRHLPESVNIPLPDLKRRLMTDVPRMMPIVLVCEHSNDAYATACLLRSLGATELYILDGGMSLWPYELK